MTREQADVVDFLSAQVGVVQRRVGKLRDLGDDERAYLGRKAKRLSLAKLRTLPCIFKPRTLHGWYRDLVAKKYTAPPGAKRKPGRPPLSDEVVDLILDIAQRAPYFGAARISDELKKLGFTVSPSSVRNVLKAHGIDPAPERGDRWSTFLKAHWGHIAAGDFFDVEVLTVFGLVRYQVFIVIDLATRKIELGGIVRQSHGAWCSQVFREISNPHDGFLREHTHLILDNDPVFTAEARKTLRNCGVKAVKLPPRSPNLNAYVERWIGSIRRELLNRVIPLSEKHLRWLVTEYIEHYNSERPHQGLEGRLIEPAFAANDGPKTKVVRRERCGGLLVSWHREAA